MKIWYILLIAASLSPLLCSCIKRGKSTNSSKQQLRLNLSGDPATMDPRKGGDVISSHMHFLLFEGLTRLDADGSTVPAQAESIDLSDDGKTYTFHMREVYWSNGDPVTAFDFEKSWKDILDPSFPSLNAHLLYPIKNAEAAKKGRVSLDQVAIRAVDAKTLVVELDNPTPYFLELTSFCVFFPVNHTIDAAHPEWAYHASEHFVSNGPYILKEWKHNNEILAIKNLGYWDKKRVNLGAIHFSIVDNETTALQMYERGELDMVGQPLSSLPVDALASLNKKGLLQKYPAAGTTIIAFNTLQPPFNNANIRKAFSYAINRKEIVDNITQLGEQPATSMVPTVLKYSKTQSFFKDHDVKKAVELLELGLSELGMKKEKLNELAFLYSTADLHHKIAQALQQQWMDVLGVKIKLENCEHKILMDHLTKRTFTFAQTIWLAQYNDQMNILERFKFKDNAKNYASWENPEYIRLLDESAYQGGLKRMATLEKAEKLFINEMPIAPIYHWNLSFLAKPYLKDVGFSPIGDIYFERISIDQEQSNIR